MVEYSKVNINVKLTDTQLKKTESHCQNKTGTTLRMSLKVFDENDLPHCYWQQDKKVKKCI